MPSGQPRWAVRGSGSTGRAPSPARCLRLRPQAVAGGGVRESEQRNALPLRAIVETGLLGDRRQTVPLLPHDGGTAESLATTTASLDAGSASSSSGPMDALRAFFLPTGWPNSVTPDYLNYQLATIPAHVTGWMSHSLATSSMIQALGMEAGTVEVAAVSAAVKWLTKDGLGAAGRLIVGGRLSSVFDEDPKRWRMVAEGVTTVGLALEIATQIFPANFVVLAGLGTLCKSMAKGMGTPCFRIIQTHFSATNNVGDVAAKEEVWEVAAQLAGLAASVATLQLLEAAGTPDTVVPVWMVVHAVHVYLRYAALSALRFPYPNQKRAAVLASSHVSSGRVPSIEEGNLGERVLLPPAFCKPEVLYGCTLDQALDSHSSNSKGEQLAELVALYSGEQYLLTWHSGAAWVLVLEGAQRLDLLRAMWQAAWLDRHHSQLLAKERQAAPGARNGNGSGGSDDSSSRPAAELLAASLVAMQQQWPDFARQAMGQGWQLSKAVLPRGTTRLRLE